MVKKAKTATRKPAATRYLYVEARGYFIEGVMASDHPLARPISVLDGPISFDSIVVRAKNEDEAYNIGAAKLQDQQASDPEMFDQDLLEGGPIEGSHASGKFLNDYVVRL